jgi:protein TonB
MLEDCLFASRPSPRSKKPATLVVSTLIHGALAGALILIPLFQNQVLPQIPLFEPVHPPVAPRGAIELVPTSKPPSGTPSVRNETNAMIVPPAIPNQIMKVIDGPSATPSGFLPGGNPRIGVPDGLPSDLFSVPQRTATPPPPPPAEPVPPPKPPAAPPVSTDPVRVSEGVVLSNLIHTVKPTYPRLAVITHTQGTVILEAVITRDGTIDKSRLRVLATASPLLTPAAVEAVEQWRYRPTLLSGNPVEVLTTITVNFSLN